MNEKQAIEFATIHGLQVSDTVKHKDGRREFNVGSITLRCAAGRRYWSQVGRSRTDTIGEAIHIAVLRQVTQSC